MVNFVSSTKLCLFYSYLSTVPFYSSLELSNCPSQDLASQQSVCIHTVRLRIQTYFFEGYRQQPGGGGYVYVSRFLHCIVCEE